MDDAPKIELVRDTDDRDLKLTDAMATARLDRWLATLVERGGSDLLLVHGAPVTMRVKGEVVTLDNRNLRGQEIESAVLPALTSNGLRLYRETQIADSSYRVNGLGGFRINLHRERSHAAAAIRALRSKVPLRRDLHLPASVEALAHLPRGLVLVGGPAGAGKTTTLAVLVHEINRRDARHILTIEDPIEYEHANIRGLIEQVEIG